MTLDHVPVINYEIDDGTAENDRHDELQTFLERNGLWGDNILFARFPVHQLSYVRQHGHDDPEISATSAYDPEECRMNPDEAKRDIDRIIDSDFFNGSHAISVFQKDKMSRVGKSHYRYTPKDSYADALVAIVVPKVAVPTVL